MQAKTYVSNGQSREAIQLLEKSLNERKDDPETEEFKNAMAELCKIYNDMASEMLESGDAPGALNLLRKAEGVGINNFCKVKTLNTLACYYRHVGKARIAENYLLKALDMQCDMSNTHVNLCAVLSELGKHEDAMLHAMQAVILMQDNIIAASKNLSVSCEPSLMAIAYINLGVELEYLKRNQEAMGFYKRALSYCAKKLTDDHPIARNAASAVQALTKRHNKEKNEEIAKPQINHTKFKNNMHVSEIKKKLEEGKASTASKESEENKKISKVGSKKKLQIKEKKSNDKNPAKSEKKAEIIITKKEEPKNSSEKIEKERTEMKKKTEMESKSKLVYENPESIVIKVDHTNNETVNISEEVSSIRKEEENSIEGAEVEEESKLEEESEVSE